MPQRPESERFDITDDPKFVLHAGVLNQNRHFS
jgi:hypothetical protein